MRRLFYVVIVIIVAGLWRPGDAEAQDAELSVSDYLNAAGLTDEAAGIEQLLRTRIRERMPDAPIERIHQHAAFFAYIFSVSGLTADHLIAADDAGVDIIHAITADSRPLSEQSLLADAVVVGDVVEEIETTSEDDGFTISSVVLVDRLLKGEVDGDTIVIRQRDASAGRGPDIRPERGHRYLLLLSNGVYRYQAARAQARAHGGEWTPGPDRHQRRRFSIYRTYPIVDGIIDWSGFGRMETEHALAEIERVDRLLRRVAPGE